MISESKIGEKAEEQLLRLIAEGDIRAIKLYYDLTEQEVKRRAAEKLTLPDMEEMAAIRRAVFGDDIMKEAAEDAGERECLSAAQISAVIPQGEESEDGDDA